MYIRERKGISKRLIPKKAEVALQKILAAVMEKLFLPIRVREFE